MPPQMNPTTTSVNFESLPAKLASKLTKQKTNFPRDAHLDAIYFKNNPICYTLTKIKTEWNFFHEFFPSQNFTMRKKV